ncbi:AAA family ATPase [candidate division KSB1 bacterium]|nr:AAA family ATPase [candidate division KSB1 bacterium]
MIKKLTLKNFKSFRDSTLELGPLSIILGANASGKSNLVDALRFLQGCTRGWSISEIFSGRWEGGQQVWTGIRGGNNEIFYLGGEVQTFSISLDWELKNSSTAHSGAYQVGIERKTEDVSFIEGKNATTYSNERFAVGTEEYVSTGVLIPETRDVFPALPMLPFMQDAPRLIRQWARILAQWMSDISFPIFSPATMREYVSNRRTELGQRGENLSAIIFRMASDPKQRQTLLEWLRELCPQEIVDFDFIQTQLGDVLLAVKEPNGVTISARSMSDGTLRFLAMVVVLLHAKEGSLFVLEDIDSDLHPSRLHLLASFLEQVTASRRIQVIATSHSPYLLDHLSEQSLANVLVFVRDQESQSTKVAKLIDIPGFSEARQHNPLDLLHASGWMEQNL